MRKLLLLAVVTTLAVPSLVRAQGEPGVRPAPPRVREPASAPLREPGAALRSTPGRPALQYAPRAPVRALAPRVGYGPWAFALGIDPLPFWLGWSWGWGYYPLWPRPYYPGYEPGYAPEEANRIAARLEAYGAGSAHSVAGTFALSIEGPNAGFDAGVTALTQTVYGNDATLTLGSAHATWSIVSEPSARLRFEAGGSMLSVPATGAYAGTSYANTLSFGPQVGLSGHVGLVGPFGLEGHARVTPFPFPIIDARAALVLRGGPLALSAGWRSIDVNGNGVKYPEAHFAGPEIGLQLVF